jgi:hypothetical protein
MRRSRVTKERLYSEERKGGKASRSKKEGLENMEKQKGDSKLENNLQLRP